MSNRLLARLDAHLFSAGVPAPVPVTLAADQILCEPGQRLEHVYFPGGAIVGLVYDLADGNSCEIAMIGHQGVLGLQDMLGEGPRQHSAVVQHGGLAWRMPRQHLLAVFDRDSQARDLLLKFSGALINQICMTSVCHSHHTLEQRLARLILTLYFSTSDPALQMTQERLSRLLGVRREGVTLAALRLGQRGLIRYQRGLLEVVDCPGLVASACECVQVMRHAYAWLSRPDRC